MKAKLYHCLLGFLYLILNPLFVQSQPSLSTSAIPELGKQITYAGFEIKVDPGSSGANVSWDFSDVNIEEIDTAIIFVRSFQSPGNCLGHDSFPTATHCVAQYFDLLINNQNIESLLDTIFDFHSYLRIENDSIFDLGSANDLPFFGLTFNVLEKPDPILIFNLEFEESLTDSIYTITVDTVLESFVDTRRMVGIDNTSYDAFGTIVLQNYELTNAVRHKTISFEEESFARRLINDTSVFSYNLSSSYSETSAWYHESSILPYVVIQQDVSCDLSVFRGDTVINSCDTTSSYTYQLEFDDGGVSTSTHSVQDDLLPLTIYPTYTKGLINLDIPLEDPRPSLRLTVRNMGGQQLSEQQLSSGPNALDLNLSPGMYLLSVDGYKTHKIVIF